MIWDVAITLTEYLTHHPELVVRKKVLDLGTGVGQLSIAAALLGCVDVVASDVQELEGLVERNVTLASQHLSGIDKKRVLNIQCVRAGHERSERSSEASARAKRARRMRILLRQKQARLASAKKRTLPRQKQARSANQEVSSCGRRSLAQRAQPRSVTHATPRL